MSALQQALLQNQVKAVFYPLLTCYDLLAKLDLKENMNDKYLRSPGKNPKQLFLREINFHQVTAKLKRQVNLLVVDTASGEYFVIRDILKEQRKMALFTQLCRRQAESVFFLVAFTDQQKEYDQSQFCIFFKILYNRPFLQKSLYKIQQCLQEFAQNMTRGSEDESFRVLDNSSVLSQNLQIQKEKLLQQFCVVTNQEVLHVECADRHIEMKQDKTNSLSHEDESLLRKMSLRNNPKFKLLMMQKGNGQDLTMPAHLKTPTREKVNASQVNRSPLPALNRLPIIRSSQHIKKVSPERQKGAQYDLKLDRVSHIDHCINALQTQQYQKLISQVQYQNIQRNNPQQRLYQRHPSMSVPLSQSHSQSYFINSHFSRQW